MASIGTDLQIRSDSGKIRPLRVQQADWETTIDRTIEAVQKKQAEKEKRKTEKKKTEKDKKRMKTAKL